MGGIREMPILKMQDSIICEDQGDIDVEKRQGKRYSCSYRRIQMQNFDINKIREFYQHSWSQNYGDNSDKETPEFWSSRSADFAAKVHSDDARQESLEFLKRFEWSRDETVLDVAAGPGTFAIPLAGMVKEVTATDFSQAMLDQLQLQASREGVSNIRQLPGRWLDLQLPGRYDTVLCLNSLGVISADEHRQPHLARTLQKLADACVRRLIILIPHADSPLNSEMRQILKLDSVPLERMRVGVLYFAMVDCGMLPDLHIIKRPFRWTFASLEEARETLLKKAGVKAEECNTAEFDAYLESVIQKDSAGRLNLTYQVSQALYVWTR